MHSKKMFVPAVIAGVGLGLLTAMAAGEPARADAPIASEHPRPYVGHKLVRIFADSPRQILAVAQLGMPIADEGTRAFGGTDYIASPAAFNALGRLGVRTQVLHEDVQAVVDAERERIERRRELLGVDDEQFFAEFRPYAELTAYWDGLLAEYPDLVSKQQIGTSIEGRPIEVYTITAPGDQTGKPGLFFNGAAHAREWISPMTVAYIATRLVEGYGTDDEITGLMDGVVFEVTPVANPDGYLYSWSNQRYWRKNRRNNGDGTFGVDWNRNFSAGFGVGSDSNTSSDVYRGPAPFSEPETRAIRDFVQANSHLVAHIDFHSYSQLVLYPWGDRFESVPEPDLSIFQNVSGAMRDAIFDTNGVSYLAIQAVDLYPAGGTSQDWTYKAGLYSWTIELRPGDGAGLSGFSPSPTLILPTGQENFEAVATLAGSIASGVTATFPAGEPVLIPDELLPFVIEIVPAFSGPLDPTTATLYSRVGSSGSFTASAMSFGGGAQYSGILPGAPCGASVEYYVEIESTGGVTYRVPAGAPDAVYAQSAFEYQVTLTDNAEEVGDWSVGAPGDTATTGVWSLMDPQGTGAQPENDNTPGGSRCWITDGRAGSGLGTYDVDGGATSLTSPRLDAVNGQGEAEVSFALWYSNDQGASPGQDVFRVLISNDDGATWSLLDSIGTSTNAWVEVAYRVADAVTPTDQVRLRFVAEDAGDGSIVEAAVDDLRVTFVGCPGSTADLTGDGVLDIDDVLAFLDAFANGEAPADLAPPAGVFDIDDVLAFLDAFAAGG